MSTIQKSRRDCFLLRDVDWQTYTRLLFTFAERPAVRLTYDRGNLEIMSPLPEHEFEALLLARFVDVLTEELGLPVKGGGSTTLRRRKKLRGLEPDKCFWIANEAKIRGKLRLNLRVDPPPDLAIEVDVTRSSLDRMDIYAKLKVPELWRLDDEQTLLFYVLDADGVYQQTSNSLCFPFVTPADLLKFLTLLTQLDDNAIVRQFRDWVRLQLGGGGNPSTPSP